jgi:hypothetical protein
MSISAYFRSSTQSEQQIRDALRAQQTLDHLEIGELGETLVPRSTILNYHLIDPSLLPEAAKPLAYRANSLMDLYYFATVVLGKRRFSKNPIKAKNLHYVMCLAVMKDGLKEGIEIPRDHFKSTVYSESFPIWRALPFGKPEEDFFSNLGYSDLYIEWMHRAHSQDIRILLVSETIKNAIKLGVRIANHYENNEAFRRLFFDILPTEKETWTADSLHQRRTSAGSGQGEGTFDFIGVGAALQSRHYNLCVQDDLVGREARKSAIVMADTIDYHQVLVGATDNDEDNPGRDFDEVVVGNRWSYDDLNSHIRREEPYFNWTTHSALGGCCSLHSFGSPIFPEAFTKEKLLRWKHRLGTYHFSCQFLNYPIDPAKKKFNLADFRYFHMEKVDTALAIPKELPWYKAPETYTPQQYRWVLRHHVAEGDVEKDVFPRYLDRYIITDPRHSDETGASELGAGSRCRHAIIVVGASSDPRRLYLLDQWAEPCGTKRYVEKLLFYSLKWKVDKIHCEAVAAQKFLIYHFNFFVAEKKDLHPEIANIRMIPLKSSQSANAKFERIENTLPMAERHEIWLDANNCSEIREEWEKYGQTHTTVDLIDTFGYVDQVCPIVVVDENANRVFLERQKVAFKRRLAAVA